MRPVEKALTSVPWFIRMERARTSDGYDLVIYYVKSHQILHEKRSKCDSYSIVWVQLNLQHFTGISEYIYWLGWVADMPIDWISFNYWNGICDCRNVHIIALQQMNLIHTASPIFGIIFVSLILLHVNVCVCMWMHEVRKQWAFCLHFALNVCNVHLKVTVKTIYRMNCTIAFVNEIFSLYLSFCDYLVLESIKCKPYMLSFVHECWFRLRIRNSQ